MRDTITLRRDEYEALLDRLEDAEDNRRIEEIETWQREVGKAAARADYLPIEAVERLCEGEHPVRVWRQHRQLTPEQLAALAGVAPSYVTEIETRKKPGSFLALEKLVGALRISLNDIAAWTKQKG